MLCIFTLFYITLTLQIMLINVIYLDISVSNIPITQDMDYSVYACSQSEPALQYNTGSDCPSEHRMILARLRNAM